MTISMAESQAITELAEILYDYLPGKPHPYADPMISFPGVASKLGLDEVWRGGSKKPAIFQMLRHTLEYKRGMFCNLILEIVQTGMAYRANKNTQITREEILELNSIIKRVGFKIPELWDPAFLDTLPRAKSKGVVEPEGATISPPDLDSLRTQLLSLANLKPQPRGYAFERFLNEFFSEFNLRPRKAFRLFGEQIDGSFQLGGHTYLVEAKWQDKLVGNSELLIFHGKVEGKSRWSRGMYLSHSGFTSEGLSAFGRGRTTTIIGFSGQDLYFVLEGKVTLQQAIDMKARRAAESGEFFTSLLDLLFHG